MKSKTATHCIFAAVLTIICLIPACSPSDRTTENSHVGTYTTKQVNSVAGYEITTGKLAIKKDGNAEMEIRVVGEIHGIGVIPVDDYLNASGTWKATTEKDIQVFLDKADFRRRGEEKKISSFPILVKIDTLMQTISFGAIEWDGGQFVILTVERWDFEPAK